MNDWDKILKDFSHKCKGGAPDLKNPTHLQFLRESLLKFGWKENAANEILGNLREGKGKVKVIVGDTVAKAKKAAQPGQYYKSKTSKRYGPKGGKVKKPTKKKPTKTKSTKKKPTKTKSTFTPQQVKDMRADSIQYFIDNPPPESLSKAQRNQRKKDSTDRINGGKTPDERTKRFLEEKETRRQEIINLEDLPAGTPASTLGEMFGGMAMEDISANPQETEDEWVNRQMNKPPPDGIKGTPLYHRVIEKSKSAGPRDLEKWLRVAHRTGKSELDVISEKKYNGKNPQTPPYPHGNIMDYKGKALVQNELENKKKDCSELDASGKYRKDRKECIAHYETQLKYLEDLEETDTGILYETKDDPPKIGFKHTSNKSSIGDQLNNTTVAKKVQSLNRTLDELPHVSEAEKQKISTGMRQTMQKAVDTVTQAESVVGRDVATRTPAQLDSISTNPELITHPGGVFFNLPFRGTSGPKPGREREYFDNAAGTTHVQAELKILYPNQDPPYTDEQKARAILESNKKGGLVSLEKVNKKGEKYLGPEGKAAQKAGISVPPKKEDEGKVFSTVKNTKDGPVETYYQVVNGEVRQQVKMEDPPGSGKYIYKPDTAADTAKVILKLSIRVKDVRTLNKKGMSKSDIANHFDPPMTESQVEELLKPEYDFIENTYKDRREAMDKAHKIIVDEVKKQDADWIRRNRERALELGIPPANGPATQAYVDTWLEDTHIKRMLLDDDTPTGMNMGGKAIEARHVRECLRSLVGKPNATPEELYDYLKKNVRVEAEGSSVVINEKADAVTGKGTKQLGKEDYRTKGDAKGVMAIFGKDMVDCLETI